MLVSGTSFFIIILSSMLRELARSSHQQSDEYDWKLYHALVETFQPIVLSDSDLVKTSISTAATEIGIRFDAIVGKLSSNSAVDFTTDHLSKLSVIFLASVLRLFPTVTSLTIGPQHLTSPSLLILLAGVEGSSIQSIDVSNNPVGSVGVQAVYQLVVRKPELRTVKLDGIQCVPSLFRKLQRVLDDRKSSAV